LAVLAVLTVLVSGFAAGVAFAGAGQDRHATESASSARIVLEPGKNQLAAAIARVEPGGTIVLQAGQHVESKTVAIHKPLTLKGEPGAILTVKTAAADQYPLRVDPAIQIQGTSNVRVEGITIEPGRHVGSTAVLIEDATLVTISGNRVLNHQVGVLVEHGEGAVITGNTIMTGLRAQDSDRTERHGIVIINGRGAHVESNTISDATYGLWVSDRDGQATGNVISGSRGGIALGRVPDGRFSISGSDRGSETTASGWKVRGNLSSDNAHAFLMMDGANGIAMASNQSFGSTLHDVELVCDKGRYGFVTVGSFEGWVASEGSREMVAKGCGAEDKVSRSFTPTAIVAGANLTPTGQASTTPGGGR